LAEKLHKLAALQLLSEGMTGLEKEHQRRIARGDNPADVDRETAQMALNGVVMFFLDLGIESTPLSRLLAGLAALSAGSSSPPIFACAATPHRRASEPTIEAVKGRLAAIMEFQQQAGLTRKAAAEWVARHIPQKMRGQLRSVKPATVDSWLVRWGGEQGADPGGGREGYLAMRAILVQRGHSELELTKILKVLERSLPS
jgi:hypothetical protein